MTQCCQPLNAHYGLCNVTITVFVDTSMVLNMLSLCVFFCFFFFKSL